MRVNSIWIAILVMALVTYLIRVLPLVLIRREIQNRTIKSFLYYVPYVTLSVMTFPAILFATESILSAAVALGIAILLALRGCKLPVVAAAASISVLLIELLIL